jgi:transcriptional regulator with XRE-family HTH domain
MVNHVVVKEFGKKIKSLRAKKNISQEELSYLTGFHRTYIGMIERGERNISLSNIAVFCKVFELNLNEILDFGSKTDALTYESFKTKKR